MWPVSPWWTGWGWISERLNRISFYKQSSGLGTHLKPSFGAYGDNSHTLTAFCLGRKWEDNNGYPVSLKIHGQQFWEGVFQAVYLVFACHHVTSGSYGVPLHMNLSQNWTRLGYHTFYLGQRSDELEESSSVVCML